MTSGLDVWTTVCPKPCRVASGSTSAPQRDITRSPETGDAVIVQRRPIWPVSPWISQSAGGSRLRVISGLAPCSVGDRCNCDIEPEPSGRQSRLMTLQCHLAGHGLPIGSVDDLPCRKQLSYADLCSRESTGVGYSRPCLSPSGPVKGELHRSRKLQLRCNFIRQTTSLRTSQQSYFT